MKLTFLGATGTVTGSKYLVEHRGRKIIVDCGLYQGLKELRERNWKPFPISPSDIDTVILTHAHIDHSGYLPLFVRDGFKGPVLCTPATYELCKILLLDSAHIQEEDANRANRYGYSKHHPALPLYTEADAEAALRRFEPIELGEHDLGDELQLSMNRSGHIIGACLLTFRYNSTSLTFTGDLGRPNDPVMKPPATLQQADYLVLDSTYGNRLHPQIDGAAQLADVVNRTVDRDGTVVISSFAVGRSQSIMYMLYMLRKQGKIPDVPIFLDSPMAQNATDVFSRFNAEHRLSTEMTKEVCSVAHYTRSVDESKALHTLDRPAIIISASGMAEGGRVLHHIARFAPDERNTLLFAGFQAAGTRGQRILSGERQIKMFGEMHDIRCEVGNLESLSSHADYAELMDWLKGFREPPVKVFLTHGEPAALDNLQKLITEEFKWEVEVPRFEDAYDL